MRAGVCRRVSSPVFTKKIMTNSGLNIDSGLHRAHADRDAWGHEWPITGGHVDDVGAKWATRRERLRHLLAIPSGSDWKIRVFSDGLNQGDSSSSAIHSRRGPTRERRRRTGR